VRAWAAANIPSLGQEVNEATLAMNSILVSYAKGDAAEFNREVANYQKWLEEHPPRELNAKKVQFEAFFNHLQPFLRASYLYLLAFALVCFSWLFWTKPLGRAAFCLILLTLALHTFALVGRIYISGRPPVTNLYSSAVFIGWGAVILGVLLERIYRLGIGSAVAATAGVGTLIVAQRLAGDGKDTFTVLQAVLDTQFWLATHVTCITLGYATTYLAGILGGVYIIGGLFTPALKPEIAKDTSRMLYGTLCFSIFFSFVGTVLGGLWADDSWGRFWGWDPKENGALIIVLWNALVLHARWDGMIKERGMAVLAVLGNIAVSWSYFGVNELGAGLHSYGFTEGVLSKLALFVLSQLALAALGLLPRQYWRSFRVQTQTA
jgi:ABC-type transport system involved in cytochrome c biogenesis permease subunit